MMKQPFTKFGVTTLFSLLCSAFLHAQVVTDERMFSFEEPQIPDCITATHSRLSVSDRKSTRLNSSHASKSRMPSSA